jgi:hypothetical protein
MTQKLWRSRPGSNWHRTPRQGGVLSLDYATVNWLPERDSNPRFLAYEASEMPLLYPASNWCKWSESNGLPSIEELFYRQRGYLSASLADGGEQPNRTAILAEPRFSRPSVSPSTVLSKNLPRFSLLVTRRRSQPNMAEDEVSKPCPLNGQHRVRIGLTTLVAIFRYLCSG